MPARPTAKNYQIICLVSNHGFRSLIKTVRSDRSLRMVEPVQVNLSSSKTVSKIDFSSSNIMIYLGPILTLQLQIKDVANLCTSNNNRSKLP